MRQIDLPVLLLFVLLTCIPPCHAELVDADGYALCDEGTDPLDFTLPDVRPTHPVARDSPGTAATIDQSLPALQPLPDRPHHYLVGTVHQSQVDSAESAPFKYVGNGFSLKFHRPSCKFAKAMHVSHVQLFHLRREAVSAGMKPCNWCLPQWWKTVNATVRPASAQAGTGNYRNEANQ